MNKSNLYIQKLIALLLVFSVGIFLSPGISVFYLTPILFLTFGYMVYRITLEKPLYLWGLQKSDEFLNNKAGFWLLFKWILSTVGFIYDLIVWVIFGIYSLYVIIVDFILVIKTILFWLVHAILWFLKLLVPPIVFIYKVIIYYGFRWNWWIYKLCFRNINISLNKNSYLIALFGAVTSIFVIMLFTGVGLFIDSPSISFIGVVFAILPIVWSFTEISFLRHNREEVIPYRELRSRFKYGLTSVGAMLFYFVVFLSLILTEVAFNILGWIPQAGLSFLGLAINVNTLSSLILLFIFIIFIFSGFILPAHIVIEGHDNNTEGTLILLGLIGKKFLRFFSSVLPTVIFSSLLALLPMFVLFLAITITVNLKNNILDKKIIMLKQSQIIYNGVERYKNEKNIELLKLYKNYPINVFSKLRGFKELKINYENIKENLRFSGKEILRLENQFTAELDSMKKFRIQSDSGSRTDNIPGFTGSTLETKIRNHELTFKSWKDARLEHIQKMEVDMMFLKSLILQLPILFLMTIIWVSIFGGLVLAFILSYLGNVYYELYGFKDDDRPSYCSQVLTQQNVINHNQPLLGFTLLIILLILLIFISDLKNIDWLFIFR